VGVTGPDLSALQQNGKLISLFACKGGVGTTFTAVNLAVALALGTKRDVCLVDFDFQMGDVQVSLNMPGRCAISQVMKEIREQGASFDPRTVLDRHVATGVYVLSQTHCLEELGLINPGDLERLVKVLRHWFSFVITDGLRTFDDTAMICLDGADKILLTINQDVPSVRSAGRTVELFRRIGYDERKVTVVVNRHNKKALVSNESISASLKLPRVHGIRNDFKLALKSLNEGKPIHRVAPQSKIAMDIDGLAMALTRKASKPKVAEKRGFFSRLRKKKK